jgi:hypothetical protein
MTISFPSTPHWMGCCTVFAFPSTPHWMGCCTCLAHSTPMRASSTVQYSTVQYSTGALLLLFKRVLLNFVTDSGYPEQRDQCTLTVLHQPYLNHKQSSLTGYNTSSVILNSSSSQLVEHLRQSPALPLATQGPSIFLGDGIRTKIGTCSYFESCK